MKHFTINVRNFQKRWIGLLNEKEYELNVELKDIPTEDLVKMVREVVIYEPDLEDIVFYDNDAEYFDRAYSTPYDAVRDVANGWYNFIDEYVQVRHKAFSYSTEEVRGKIMSKIRVLLYAYTEWLAIDDLEYRHLFREVK